MRRVILTLVSMALFGTSVFVGITGARLVTQQQGLDALVLGSSMFQVVIGGTSTLPLQAVGLRPGASSEEPFTVTLASSTEIRALVSASLSPEDQAVAADKSGNGNHGTLVGGPTWGKDEQRRFLAFDGVNDHVDLGTSSSLSPTSQMTVAFWLKYNTYSPYTAILEKSQSAPAQGYKVRFEPDGRIAIFVAVNGVFEGVAVPSISTPRWRHVAGVFENGTLRVYADGVLAGSIVVGPVMTPDLTRPLFLGSYSWAEGYRFNGYMAEVRLYDRALSPLEVQALVNGTAPSTDPNLKGYWPLNHGITPGFDGRLNGELALQGATIWGPAPVANLVAESPVFLAILAGGQTIEPTLRVSWPNGTPQEDNPFQGARFIGDLTVDAVQTVGSIFDSCVDTSGKAVPGGGAVTFLGGRTPPQWGDPGCSSTRSFPRMTGLYADFQVAPTTPGARWAVGFVSGSSLSDFVHVVLFDGPGGIYLGNGTSVTAMPGAGSTSVGNWVAGSTYRVRIMLKKAGGATYWLQGPGFAPLGGGAWTKVGESAIGTAASLSPTASNWDQTGVVSYVGP